MKLEIGKIYKIEGYDGLYRAVSYYDTFSYKHRSSNIIYPEHYDLINIITKNSIPYYTGKDIESTNYISNNIKEATEKEIKREEMFHRASVLREKFHGKEIMYRTGSYYFNSSPPKMITSEGIVLDVVYSPTMNIIYVIILNIYDKSIFTICEKDIDLFINCKINISEE